MHSDSSANKYSLSSANIPSAILFLFQLPSANLQKFHIPSANQQKYSFRFHLPAIPGANIPIIFSFWCHIPGANSFREQLPSANHHHIHIPSAIPCASHPAGLIILAFYFLKTAQSPSGGPAGLHSLCQSPSGGHSREMFLGETAFCLGGAPSGGVNPRGVGAR